MSSAHDPLLKRLCGKEETLNDARELLNIARTKTGLGSGHNLGASAVGLPAICALLASQRLSNNDVVEQVAQQASCLNAKQFRAALNTVRSALAGHLRRSKARGSAPSYGQLCKDHGLDDDTLYWLEEVDKELYKSVRDADEEIDVDKEVVIYVVFYWTCIALNIRSVKRSTIMSDYMVTLVDLQYLEGLLDAHCFSIRESIGKFVGESRSARSGGAQSPTRMTPTTPTTASPDKSNEILTKIRATPSVRRHFPVKAGAGLGSELATSTQAKRKAAQLPPLPFPVPASLSPAHKRQKLSGSATKLMRVPVAKTASASASVASTPTKSSSPAKTYAANRSFLESNATTPVTPSTIASSPSPTRHGKEANRRDEEAETPRKEEKEKRGEVVDDTDDRPLTPVKDRIERSMAAVEVVLKSPTRSPKKVLLPPSACATEDNAQVTPTPSRVRSRVSKLAHEPSPTATPSTIRSKRSTKSSPVRAFMRTPTARGRKVPALADEDGDEAPTEPPCRHRILPFADRLFYHYRDPRVVREWDACGWSPEASGEQGVTAH